ncbi:metallophosphoesterase, partial [Arthrospira platensis SPKY1]|nr:metallophosphoesterase [Arthrospira platensis SPKY1]
MLEAERDSDVIYCTGDLVDVGFYPQEVVDRVREAGVICVQGNHDRNVIQRYEEQRNPALPPRDFVDLNAQQLKAEAIDYLKQLPMRITFEHDGVAYLLQHLYQGYDLIQTMDEYEAFWGDAPWSATVTHRAVL